MAENIVVKASLEIKEIRRFSTDKRANIQQIKDSLTKSFPFLTNNNSNLSLSWTDADGDRVIISSNSELEDAMKNITDGVLKLHITLTPEASLSEQQNIPERAGPTPEVEDYHQSFSQPYSGHSFSNQYPSVDEHINSINSILSIGQPPTDDVATQNEQTGQQASDPVLQNGPQSRPESFAWPYQDCTALNRIKINQPFRDARSRETVDAYRQGQKNGRLIIINNNRFPNLPAVEGLDHDATCLSDLFKKLKFDVKTLNNPTQEAIKNLVDKDKAKGYEIMRYGCYIVVVLSRCESNTIYDCQGNTMELWELTDRIYDIKELEGKPKIFIIEGFTGNGTETFRNDSDMEYRDESTKTKTVVVTGSHGNSSSATTRGGQDQTDATSISQDDDVLLLKANTYGKGKPHIKGSVFVQALVDVVCQRAYQDSFQDIIKQVNNKLQSSSCQDLTTPVISRQKLKKQLYFYP